MTVSPPVVKSVMVNSIICPMRSKSICRSPSGIEPEILRVLAEDPVLDLGRDPAEQALCQAALELLDEVGLGCLEPVLGLRLIEQELAIERIAAEVRIDRLVDQIAGGRVAAAASEQKGGIWVRFMTWQWQTPEPMSSPGAAPSLALADGVAAATRGRAGVGHAEGVAIALLGDRHVVAVAGLADVHEVAVPS